MSLIVTMSFFYSYMFYVIKDKCYGVSAL